jgi:hypothetical protein
MPGIGSGAITLRGAHAGRCTTMRFTPFAGSSGTANLLLSHVDGSSEMLNHAVECYDGDTIN